MKPWSEIFILTLFFVSSWCYYNPNKKPKTTTKPPITKYYVDNWYKYRIPKEISVESLKSVLDLVAKYRDELYCPFGNFVYCEDKNVKEVVDKIILDIVTAEKKELHAKAEANSPCALANKMPARTLGMCMAKYNFLREKNSKLKETSHNSIEDSNEDLSEFIDFNDVEYKRKHNGKSHKKHRHESHKRHHYDYEGYDDEGELTEFLDKDFNEFTGFDDEKYEHKHNKHKEKSRKKHRKKSHKKHHNDYKGYDDEGELMGLSDEDLTEFADLNDVKYEHKHKGKCHNRHRKRSHKKHKKHHRHRICKEDDDEGDKFKGKVMVLHAYNSLKVRKHPRKLVNMRDYENPLGKFGKR